jgi:hypothetical protein
MLPTSRLFGHVARVPFSISIGDDALTENQTFSRNYRSLDVRQEARNHVVVYRGEEIPTPTDLLQGTLDLLILQTLAQ